MARWTFKLKSKNEVPNNMPNSCFMTILKLNKMKLILNYGPVKKT